MSPLASIRVRIVAAFLAALIAMLGALVFQAAQNRHVAASQALLTEGYLPLALEVDQLRQDHQLIDNDIGRLVRNERRPGTGAASATLIYSERLRQSLLIARAHAKQALQMAEAPEEVAALNKTQTSLLRVEEHVNDYQEQAAQFLKAAESTSTSEPPPEALLNAGRLLGEEIDKLAQLIDSRVQTLSHDIDAQLSRATAVASALTALALVFSMGLIGAVLYALQPLDRLTHQVQRLASGDYSGRVEVRGSDEVAALATEFNTMVEALQLRDRALERMARSERLALIGQMLAQITHEVRNPLNAMSLNAEMLSEELTDLDPKRSTEAWELLDTISNEIERLTSLTGHYLQLARRPPAELEPTPLRALIEEVLRLLSAELEQRGAHVDTALAHVPSQRVDGNQLRQALLNIVRNATEAGAHALRLSLSLTETHVILSLEDDGQGMSPEEVDRALDPFFSTKAAGTGLGLAITRQILEDHDGTVKVESTPGRGTTVALVFPRRDEEETP